MEKHDSRRYLAYLATVAGGLVAFTTMGGTAQAATSTTASAPAQSKVTISPAAHKALVICERATDRTAYSADNLFSDYNQTYTESYTQSYSQQIGCISGPDTAKGASLHDILRDLK